MTKNKPCSDNLIGLIIQGMEDIKGEDISILDLRNIENTVCDYFIICDGSSNVQVNSIISSINKVVRRGIKEKPYQIEGMENSEWVLMDYIDVVVHVFKKDKRSFYDIESLWGDATITKIKSSY